MFICKSCIENFMVNGGSTKQARCQFCGEDKQCHDVPGGKLQHIEVVKVRKRK